MAKRKQQPLGEITITRGETDDAANANRMATWRLSAGAMRASIMRRLGDAESVPEFVVTTWKASGPGEFGMLEVGRSAVVRSTDFAAVVARARQLMENHSRV